MSIARTLVAALAVTALAAPAAHARPADIHASFAEAAAKAQQKQDLRSPDGIEAAAKAQQKQDLRSPDGIEAAHLRGHAAADAINARGATAVDSATRPAPRTFAGPPTWPANPQPIAQVHAVKVVDDGGVDWTTIGLGIAGGLLAISVVAFLTTRRRRTQRLRLAS